MKLDDKLQITGAMKNLQSHREHDQTGQQQDSNQAFNDIEFPAIHDNSEFTENTNSQFYMWEGANQRDSADFENDIIASTNEVAYTRALLKEQGIFDSAYLNERMLE